MKYITYPRSFASLLPFLAEDGYTCDGILSALLRLRRNRTSSIACTQPHEKSIDPSGDARPWADCGSWEIIG